MKYLGLLLLVILIASPLSAQECISYAPMQEGRSIEMTNYDKKDKMSSKSVMKVGNVQTSAGVTSAEISAEIFDDKGKMMVANSYDVKCDGSDYSIEMSAYMSQEQLAAMGDIDIEIDGDWLVLPARMSVGDKLEDGKVTASASSGGTAIMSFTMSIEDRTVVGKEQVSTPAGEFEAMKLSYKYSSKMAFVTFKGSAEEWWVKDIGVVKSISYNKKGKKVSSTMLTALK